MVNVILRSGFEPSQGLGKNLEIITEPIVIPGKAFRYRLGY